MQDKQYRRHSKTATAALKLVRPETSLKLAGSPPSDAMAPGRYLVQCDTAWLEPVSNRTREHRAVLQFRVVDGKFAGIGLRMWIDKAADAGGVISPSGKYARHCAIALGRPLGASDPITDPSEIFAGHRFLVLVGYRKSELPKGRGRQSDELALKKKDDRDELRIHEILSCEDLG